MNKLATLFIFAEILKIQRDHQTDFVALLKVEGLKKVPFKCSEEKFVGISLIHYFHRLVKMF